MLRFSSAVAIAVTVAPLTALAQSAERAAEAKARCVHEAIYEAGKVFTPNTLQKPGTITSAANEAAKRELDEFSRQTEVGVRKCVSEAEVYQLGWFSFLEDTVLVDGSSCRAMRASAFKYQRTKNDNDGDLINGAVKWQQLVGDWEKTHPFYRGQADSRANHRHASAHDMCRALSAGFGPRGTRFPGLIR